MLNTTKRNTQNLGFTLIELLIVVAIIGVLTSIVMVFLTDARQKSRDGRRFEDFRQIKNALELYSADHNGLYLPGTDLSLLVTKNYIQVFPIDPLNTGSYSYSYQGANSSGGACSSGLCASYVLKTVLEQSSQSALDVDIDGTFAGVDCVDPAFCVIP